MGMRGIRCLLESFKGWIRRKFRSRANVLINSLSIFMIIHTRSQLIYIGIENEGSDLLLLVASELRCFQKHTAKENFDNTTPTTPLVGSQIDNGKRHHEDAIEVVEQISALLNEELLWHQLGGKSYRLLVCFGLLFARDHTAHERRRREIYKSRSRADAGLGAGMEGMANTNGFQ